MAQFPISRVTSISFGLVMVLLIFAGILQAQTPSYVPTNGLVGWWPFNGNANDESGNGNHGTVNGATLTSDRFGNANTAYSFNGVNNNIIVAHNNNLNLTSFTISSWVKISNPNNSFYEIMTKGGDLDENYEHLIYGNPVPPFGAVECAIKWTDGTRGYSNTPVLYLVTINQWTFILTTYDVNTGKLMTYVNGLFSWEASPNKTPKFNTTPLYIGSDPSLGRFHLGLIDDVLIFNRALSQQEITQLYTGTVTPSTPEDTTSNVGIGTTTPKRKLHVNDVMRLEPRNTVPANPGEGDIYYDANLKKIRYYNGTTWINL